MISSHLSTISRIPTALVGRRIHVNQTIRIGKQKRYQPPSQRIQFQCLGTKPLFSNQELRQKGIFDAKDVLVFDTLHEMRVNATQAFHNNPLFGTFKDGKYDWMSFGEWGKTVDICRNVLKDLGKYKG